MRTFGNLLSSRPLTGVGFVVITATALLCGCRGGEPDYVLKGRVTYKAKPVPRGTVAFAAAGKSPRAAKIGADGSYEVRLPAGVYQVKVSAPPPLPPAQSAMDEFNFVSKEPPLIPDRYNEFGASGLTVDVAASDDNVQDFALQ